MERRPMYADLHCHPAQRMFNKLRNSDDDTLTTPQPDPRQNIWYLPPEDIKFRNDQLKKGYTWFMGAYPECDIITQSQGNVRLTFASLYPIEKGFVMGNARTQVSARALKAALELLLAGKGKRWLGTLLGKLLGPLDAIITPLFNSNGPARDWLQGCLMRFNKNRINFLQSRSYDYFTELQYEHLVYVRADGQQAPDDPACKKYQLVKGGSHLQSIIETTDDLAIVMTLEGMHMLSQRTRDINKLEYVGWEEMSKRIRTIKDWNVFFITFSHHYDNSLAGHAQSLPKLLREITDQSSRLHAGFNEDGMRAVRLLLSVTPSLDRDPAAGHRVLIDVKHMAANARKQLYNEVIIPYNKKNTDKIPVIASHVGYANRKTLDELIAAADKEDDDAFKDAFYQWNINLCDEDVKVIVESGGLIGLSFDQRIIGVEPGIQPSSVEAWSWHLANNIFAFVRSCMQMGMDQPYRVWDCIAFGTDFDGFIDPVDAFALSTYFGAFKGELFKRMDELGDATKQYLGLAGNPYTPAQVADKIAFGNAYNFTVKNFNK